MKKEFEYYKELLSKTKLESAIKEDALGGLFGDNVIKQNGLKDEKHNNS